MSDHVLLNLLNKMGKMIRMQGFAEYLIVFQQVWSIQFLSRNPRFYLSHVVRKPDFCICENKDADQLRGNREADQRLCFRYIDSTIPLLSKSEIPSL